MASLSDIPLLAAPFFFLRHGETEANRSGVIAGCTDIPLTPRGHAQARDAAAVLKGRGITAIYASSLSRARDTADYVAQALGLPVVTIPEISERNWGILEGKPRVLRKPGVTPPGAETPEVYAARVWKGLACIAGAVPLVVAHSGVFRVLCRSLGIPEPSDPVANAMPLRCVPPDPEHSAWRFEPVQTVIAPRRVTS